LRTAKSGRDKLDDSEPDSEAFPLLQGSQVHCGPLSCASAMLRTRRINNEARIFIYSSSYSWTIPHFHYITVFPFKFARRSGRRFENDFGMRFPSGCTFGLFRFEFLDKYCCSHGISQSYGDSRTTDCK